MTEESAEDVAPNFTIIKDLKELTESENVKEIGSHAIWSVSSCKQGMHIHITAHFQIKKSNLHYTRGMTPKRLTSGGVHLRGLAPG